MNIPSSLILLVSAHEVKLLRQGASGGEIEQLAHLSGKHLHDSHAHAGTAHAGSQHAVDPHHARQEKERGIVASRAIDALRSEWAKGGYDQIVMSAPDKLLGLLRKAMPKDLAHHVNTSLDKDLVKTPTHDLADHLGVAIRF